LRQIQSIPDIRPFAEEIGNIGRQRRECRIESLPRAHPLADVGDRWRAQTDANSTAIADRNGLADMENSAWYVGDTCLKRRSQCALHHIGCQRHPISVTCDDRKYRPAPDIAILMIPIDQIKTG
jgi:hypothetical protein